MKGVFSGKLLQGVALVALAGLCACSTGKVRERMNFDQGWRFTLSGDENSWKPETDDSSWRLLDLPHDWSIEGDFNPANPATTGGGALPGGTGWYRKSFTLNAADKDKVIYIDFDGVYRNSEVWINGHYLGKRPYGYSSFSYELTPYLKQGDEKNIIAVKVDNSQQPNSRWYSGSGIYRNVWLVKTGKIAVEHWGTYITTPEVSREKAVIKISVKLRNSSGKPEEVTIVSTLLDAHDKTIAVASSPHVEVIDTITSVRQNINVGKPELWSDKRPYLYTVKTAVKKGSTTLDEYETTIGIRSFVFDADKGFILNGVPVKIRGVCDHHDLGCLGAAINTRALERQLEILRDMGCNAIRTSHNPPAPELLDLCDRMGFIVMDEAFDMWKKSKTQYDYSLDFDKWHKRDLSDMVKRDRNHPSVFIWSIGNEILEQWDSTGITIARDLAAIVRELDTTRPITSACNDPQPGNYIIRSGALDLIGYNYHQDTFADFQKTFPDQKFIGTETTSALATRGSYDMPSDSVRRWPERWDKPFNEGNKDMTCSSYDNCSAPWGSTNEETWKIVKAHDFLSGMFIWTGFDYLGEPTPYPWPARSSYFGIIDLSGFPKDPYYMYQSEWTDKPVLHLFPHWNWKQGEIVDVWVYTNCSQVELLLNGKSLGTKSKQGDELHLMWRVPFEAGTLTAVGRDKNGTETMKSEVKTAGEPAKISLTPDRTAINADGSDLSFVKVEILDKDGNLVPHADNLVKFSIEGDAVITAVDNGCQTSMEHFRDDKRKAFNGMCLAVVKAGSKKGKATLKASSEGLPDAVTYIDLK
jgi:beta-galactosidase